MSKKSVHATKVEGRSKRTGEDFTPPWLINQMLDKLPPHMWEPGRTFCDPACGDGNMLLEILKRKLDRGHAPVAALATLFGCDCMDDNIKRCRLRLLKLIHDRGHAITRSMLRELLCNIVLTRVGQKYERGSLSYHFDFHRLIEEADPRIAYWLNGIEQERWLERFESEDVDITVGAVEEEATKAHPDELLDAGFAELLEQAHCKDD